MRICLVEPKGLQIGLNTGLGYIASYLQQNNDIEEIKVFDFNNYEDDIGARIDEIKSFDVIGISIKTLLVQSAVQLAEKIKRKGNILIVGGPHISIQGKKFLEDNILFDFGFSGEGEIAVSQFIGALVNKTDYQMIPGLIYRKKNGTVSQTQHQRVVNLDELPFPNYSVFDSYQNRGITNYPLQTSRGCPYACSFCCIENVIGKKWTARSITNIIQELHEAKRKYNIKSFNIQDDNFSLNLKRAKTFCDTLLSENINLPWNCQNGLRADKVDNELIKKIKIAGCRFIAVGIESIDEKVFDAINKGETLTEVVDMIKMCNANKLDVYGNFIIGLPHSNYKTVQSSIKFAKKYLDSSSFSLLIPFPGTYTWEWAHKHGRILRRWKDSFASGKNPIVFFETDEFTEKERIRVYIEANIKLKNYFAFINESDPFLVKIINVLILILRHDLFGIPSHIYFWIKNSTRIYRRATNQL